MRRVRRQVAFDGALLALAMFSGIGVLAARRENPVDAPSLLLPSLLDDQPTSLTLKRGGRAVHATNRSNSPDAPSWFVGSPWGRTADAATVDAAIAALRELQSVRKLASAPSVAQLTTYGLDRPLFTWEVDIAGAKWTLNFGADAPAPRGGTYIDISGPNEPAHQIYVATVDTTKLSLQPEQLLEPRLLPYVPSEFRELTIETEAAKSKFRFDPQRARWYEADGAHRRIARESIDKLLFDLANLKAERFFTSAESVGKSWKKRQALVSFSLDKGSAIMRLALLGACEGQSNLSLVRVLGNEEVTACAAVGTLQNRLEAEPSGWIDRHLFSLRTDEIERATVQVEGRLFELERRESAFTLAGNDTRPIDINTGNDALNSLVSIQGTPSEAPLGAGPITEKNYVLLRSAVVAGADGYEERLLVGQALPNGDRWVERVTDSTWLRVDAESAASLAPGDNWLRSKILIDSDPSAVQMIELVSRGKSLRWTVDGKGHMHTDSEGNLPFDSDTIEKLRVHLARLRANQWLDRNDAPTRGRNAAKLTFEISDGDGAPRLYTLEFALGSRRRTTATMTGSNDRFEPEPELAELLMKALK